MYMYIYIYMYVWLVGQSSQSHRPTLTGCSTGVKLKSPNPAGDPGLLQWLPKASWGGVAGRNSALGNFFLPKQCGHTEGVLTVGVKARWLIDMVSGAFGMFPIIFRDILPRNLLEGACTEILLRDLLQRSCQQSSYRDLVQRPGTESSDLAQGSFIDSLNRDLIWHRLHTSSVGISYTDLSSRVMPGDLFWRSCTETLHRDLLQRSCPKVSYINLSKRVFVESLYRDLIKRSCQEISARDLVQEVLPRDLV